MNAMRLGVILILLNTMSAVGVVYLQYEKRTIGMQMSQQESVKDDHVARWSQLLVEHAAWSSNFRIEKIASEKLDMRYEYDDFIYVRL
ncbi:MAG: cell division protein FtsL [Gammaproteobacteria bacterium]|nr:MAG: cell division protein FtsL [Gammaproteobacteria bacterium]